MRLSLLSVSLLPLIALVLYAVAGPEGQQTRELVKLPEDEDGVIQLPVRFHIIKGIEMSKRGVEMKMWVTPEDVEGTILPEINRIWRPARIQWVAESISVEEPAQIPSREETIRDIARATRETPDRTKKILSLFDPKKRHPVVNNLYLFPFVGATSQGFASFGGGTSIESNPDGGSRCVVGVWTDKPSGARKPPQRFPLREELPFKVGSIARTCSHELGHNLLLQHPDKATQTTFHRLMGGRRHGYDLTPKEIALARRVAVGRAKVVLKWAK